MGDFSNHHGRQFDDRRCGFPGDAPHHYQPQPQQQQHPNNHFSHHQHQNYTPNYHHHYNGEPFESFGGGGFGSEHFVHPAGRKRGFHHPARGSSADYVDDGSYVKLYVASVPRVATEEVVRPLFEEHGNVVEVVLMKDKKTGHQQGACFVKYATIEEAERAIRALNNQHTFPGELCPIKVRYADAKRERVGALEFKLYVGGLNRQASKKEIEEIFSPYGPVEDVYIVRDELKQSRGCGFIKFSFKDMALAAINALNGVYTMRGCDQPLIVRFADPKKPKTTESGGSSAFRSSGFGPHFQEPGVRLPPNLCEPMDRHVPPNPSYLPLQSNPCPPMQQVSSSLRPEAVSQMEYLQSGASHIMQQPIHSLQKSPSQLPQMPPEQTKVTQESYQSSEQEVLSETQSPSHLIQSSTQSLKQEQGSQVIPHQGGSNCQVASTSNASAVSAVLESALPVDSPDCDWSEHICPDGYKYYYNCITCESRWEKPEEFVSFEQQLLKQQQLPRSSSQQFLQVQFQRQQSHLKCELQQPLLSAQEFVQGQAGTAPIIAPTCVQ